MFRTKLEREANRVDEKIFDAALACKYLANDVIGLADPARNDLVQAIKEMERARYIVRQLMHRDDVAATE